MASRSVRCRAGQVARAAGQQRQPLLQPGQQRRRRQEPRPAPRPARWPAAGRRAGGRSRRPPAAFSAVSAKSGLTACARSTKSATAGMLRQRRVNGGRPARPGSGKGGTGILALAAQAQRRPAGGQDRQLRAGRQQVGDAGAASSTCSKLSSTSSSRCAREDARPASSSSGWPAVSRTPSAAAMVGTTRAGSVSGARSTKKTPSGKRRAPRRRPPGPGGSCRCRPGRSGSPAARSSLRAARRTSATSSLAADEGVGWRRQVVRVAGQRAQRRELRPAVRVRGPGRPAPAPAGRAAGAAEVAQRHVPAGRSLGQLLRPSRSAGSGRHARRPASATRRLRREPGSRRHAARPPRRAAPCAPAAGRSVRPGFGLQRPLAVDSGGQRDRRGGEGGLHRIADRLEERRRRGPRSPLAGGPGGGRPPPRIAARSRSQSAVLPSMSVKRKVTVPLGRSAMIPAWIDRLLRGVGGLSHAGDAVGTARLPISFHLGCPSSEHRGQERSCCGAQRRRRWRYQIPPRPQCPQPPRLPTRQAVSDLVTEQAGSFGSEWAA